MSDIALHKYLSRLPEAGIQEFIEWCVLEQSKVAGCEFTPDQRKLNNLPPAEYVPQIIDQFMKVKPDPIKAGLVAAIAGKEADEHGLSGLAVLADFIALYIKYLIPKDGNTPQQAEMIINDASQQQYEKFMEIANKHGIKI
ncbi:hypothetical protein VB620_19645 [Nodularia harveyana UHCC-0300]|uniref:Uncharacterized protein n=1 Tax=Nodularia harveyana UHCC-0300 TaxID=2974287 RepID=A0ABU5UJ65_9CYAN|nr:hypothetical protein [Nodularia harveyana]MEA5583544.1 hypothetical protein [Nodularia harveyana UHCC-0300]